MRIDGRRNDQLRPIKITPHVLDYAEGSALIEAGNTRVLCAVSVQAGVPRWLDGQNRGWLTAEYAMLPRATHTRTPRETTPGARTQEIRRLIGRSLRAAVNLGLIGENTITIDCDVLQADGGTRTASITGGYVALVFALRRMIADKVASPKALVTPVAAVSAGIIGGEAMLDLCYPEDSRAESDFNVVMTGKGDFIEVQGTAEGAPYSRAAMNQLIDLATAGINELIQIQNTALAA